MRAAFQIGLIVALAMRVIVVNAAPVDAAGTDTLAEHMHEHYEWVTGIQNAIIHGDLNAIREPARWLAEHPAPAEAPAAWLPHLETLRSAARIALNATNLTTAATATSQIANACGNCHVANNVSDPFPWTNEPDEEMNKLAHMQRHQWAADRMWEGLIGPSDDAWYRGADLLLEAPLSAQQLDFEDDSSHNIRRMARRIHQLAANGKMEYEAAGKADIYAEFLATCAACHTLNEPTR